MTPTITAAELFAAVEPLPRKWWPDRVFWHKGAEEFSREEPPGFGPNLRIDAADAYLLFVGHLTNQALAGGATIRAERYGSPDGCVVIGSGEWSGVSWHANNLLAALVAYFEDKESPHAK